LGNSEGVIVKARGLRVFPLVWRVSAAGFGALGVWLIAISVGYPKSGAGLFIPEVAAVLLAMLSVDLGLEEYFSNRWIEIVPAGITSVYRFHRRFAPWAKLVPLKDSILNQTGFSFDRGGDRRTQLIVTFEQMRAVLAHPSCPKWTLAPGLAHRLNASRTAV